MDIKKILIAVDDSNFAEYAAIYGFNLARTLNAAVGIVHVVEPAVLPPAGQDTTIGLSTMGNTMDGVANAEILSVQDDASDNLIQQTISRFGEGMEVSHFTDYGSTSEGIMRCSREFSADLIVMGTHSRTGIDRLLMGSVAEKVIRNSTIPVLVVPMKAADKT